jgi:hypothetical protein
LGTAKTITFLTNSLIIIWREGHFAHVARNLLLVEFTKIRGTQNFGGSGVPPGGQKFSGLAAGSER